MNSQGTKGNTQSLNHNTPEVCFFSYKLEPLLFLYQFQPQKPSHLT